MKKIICIPFFLAAFFLIASCKGTVTPENPDDSQNQNHEQQENQDSSIINKFFWGTWVRMDSGAVYVIDESQITVYKKDSSEISNVYDAVSSTESELSVSGIGKFTKQSDSVIQNNAIPFFRKGGFNLSYSMKLVGFEDTVSRAASSITPGSVKVKATSKKYKSYKKEAEPTDDGVINLTAPVSGDEQTVTVSTKDTVLVIPEIKIENDGSDMGTIPVTNPGEYSLKVTGVISDDQKDDGYLYGNNLKTYTMTLTITNISEVTSETSACEIKSEDPQLKITDENGAALNAITFSTLKPGLTKEIKLKVTYGTIDSGYVDTGLNINIRNLETGRTWKDYVPLRFFRGMLPITVSAKSTENNKDAALNGFVIYPDYNSQFFDIQHGTSKTLYVPDFGKDKTYILSFSGATVEGELSASTEMFYVVNPGSTEQDYFTIPTTTDDLMTCYNYGEPNDTEFDAVEVSDKFTAYLNDGDIDFFSVKIDYDDFIFPDKALKYRVTFEDPLNKKNCTVKLFKPGEKLGQSLSRSDYSCPEGYQSFSGWFLNNETWNITETYVVNSNITLYARYIPKNYTITYNLNDGSYTKVTGLYTIEEEKQLYIPTRENYIFKGWYDSSDFSGNPILSIPLGSFGDKSFYAKWEPVKYNIVYNLNGGIQSDLNPDYYTIEQKITLSSPVRSGYYFVGWYEKSDFFCNKMTEISKGTSGDITLWACWDDVIPQNNTATVYNIIYNPNGGVFDSQSNVHRIFTSDCTDIDLEPLVREGYIFEGWYTEDTFENKIDKIPTGSTQDYCLYARWGIKVFPETLYTFAQNSSLYDVVYYEGGLSAEVLQVLSDNLPDNKKLDLSNTTGLSVLNYKSYTQGGYYTSYFSSCKAVVLPDSLISIDKCAFVSCLLSEIIIPGNVENIGQSTFSGCRSLKRITIPDSVTNIGSYAFDHCSSLEQITIPENVTSIDSSAFDGCSSLTKITIPESVTSIGSRAFYGCSSLTEITIPDSVTSIGFSAFYGCSSLTEITIPENVSSIETNTFYGCSSLTEITISENVSSIGSDAFSGCSSLTEITIPENVTSIGSHAFSSCSSLTEITIPENVTSIGSYAFSDCSSLKQISIPEGVKGIESETFEGCSSLIQITIPIGVTSIGSYAFEDCSSLKEIIIPQSLSSIESSAFRNCSKLKKINYNGTKTQWKSAWNSYFPSGATVYCTNGNISL